MNRKTILVVMTVVFAMLYWGYIFYKNKYENHLVGSFFSSEKWRKGYLSGSGKNLEFYDSGVDFVLVRNPPIGAVNFYKLILKHKIDSILIVRNKNLAFKEVSIVFYSESNELTNSFEPSVRDDEWSIGGIKQIVNFRENLIGGLKIKYVNGVEVEYEFNYYQDGILAATYNKHNYTKSKVDWHFY